MNSNNTTYHVQLFKLGTGEGLGEVFSLKEGLDLDAGLVLGRQGPLRLLHFPTQLLDGAVVFAHVFARLLLVQLDEVFHDALVKVFSSEVGVSVGGHDFKHAVVNGEQRDIEGAATEIEDEDVLLAVLFVQTVSNRSSGSVI